MTTQPAGVAVTLRSVAKPAMVMRSLRFPLTLWERAKAKADRTEQNLSDVIRRLVEDWVNEDEE